VGIAVCNRKEYELLKEVVEKNSSTPAHNKEALDVYSLARAMK
jgi:hypothetical protein